MAVKVESKVIFKSANGVELLEVDELNKIGCKPYSINFDNLLDLASACEQAHELITERLERSGAVPK